MPIEDQPTSDAAFVDSMPESKPAKHSDPYENNPQDRPPGDMPPADGANSSHVGAEPHFDDPLANLQNEAWLVQKAEEIYTDSTDYLDSNITNSWEVNLSHFHNEHSADTAYARKDWRRSRVFRPKTRAITKAQEATLAVAAFATQEFVNIEAEDPQNPQQVVSADINKHILQYRLDRRLPWFQTVIGAFQDTKVYGVCISHQYWDYQKDTRWEPAFDDFKEPIFDEVTGEQMGYEVPVVRADKLCIDNVAPENFRFDPMADWRDPVNTSPYLIYMRPMYAGEVQTRMRQTGPDGKPVWLHHSRAAITASQREKYDRTRQAREGDRRVDPINEQNSNEFTTVWAHMNIIRIAGDDYVYWTLGTMLLLTKPVLLTKEYPHLDIGERPFTLGKTTIETHRNYPAGDIQQSAGLQREINAIANQRMDNVKLVLNKRYYVRRGSQVDLDALVRNVPGGGVMMNDPEKDVKTVDTRDVTSSSYQEQSLLNVEMDELSGNFSQGDAQNKRNPSDTALGIAELSGSANAVQDYSIRIFMETWMEPALRQAVRLIQHYETDEVILNIATSQSKEWQRFGASELTDELLRQDLTVRVNLGIGNTDPVRRVERLTYAVDRVGGLPGMAARMKTTDIGNEIFGALGYKNSSRFFMSDEEFQQMQAEQGEQGPPPEVAAKMRELDIREKDNQARDAREQRNIEYDREIKMAELALKREMTLEQMYAKLGIDREKIATTRDTVAIKEHVKMAQIGMKQAAGGKP